MNIQLSNKGIAPPKDCLIKGHIYKARSNHNIYIATIIDDEDVIVNLLDGSSHRPNLGSNYYDITNQVSLQDIRK